MLMGTLELPRRMIDAAKSYAERENLTVADLFAELLHSRFGYSITLTVSRPQAPIRKKRVVNIPDSIKSISGIVSLPDGQTEDDIIRDAVQLESARTNLVDVIVTRNVRHFKDSPIRVCTPSELLAEDSE